MLLCADLFPIDIQQVSDGLKGIEGDSERNNEVQLVRHLRCAEGGKQGVDLRKRKMRVFRDAEDADVGQQRRQHDPFSAPLVSALDGFLFLPCKGILLRGKLGLLPCQHPVHAAGRKIDAGRRKQDEKRRLPAHKRIKHCVCQQEHAPLQLSGNQVIHKQEGKHKKKKCQRCNAHEAYSSS